MHQRSSLPVRRIFNFAGVIALSVLSGYPQVRAAETALQVPVYAALPCCRLCPRAADPESYVTTTMKGTRILAEGADGWLFRTENDLIESVQPPDPRLYDDMARLRKALNARGVQVVMVSSPPRGLVEYQRLSPALRERYNYDLALKNYRAHLDSLRAAGFIVPDSSKFANESVEQGDNFYLQRDLHWTSAGARRTAQLVAAEIRAQKLDADLPHKEYTTTRNGSKTTFGTISRTATQLCGGQYPGEPLALFATTTPPSDDLFGESNAPAVTLVGTSFSQNPDYHFAGFLQSELQTEVLNAAFAGGNFDGAITKYLLSDAFQQSPPKILIWETAYQFFQITERVSLRRLIPLVNNGCVGRPSVLESEVSMKGADPELTELLFNGGANQDATNSRDLVLDLQFDDPNVKDISADVWYLDGNHETLRSRYNDFTNTNGRYVFELSPDGPTSKLPPVAIRGQIVTALSKSTKVKARLCKAVSK